MKMRARKVRRKKTEPAKICLWKRHIRLTACFGHKHCAYSALRLDSIHGLG